MQEDNLKVEAQKLNVWITKSQKDFLRTKAEINSVSIATIVREAIDMYQNVEALNTNIDKICEIIDKQMERSFKRYLDRVIKLIIKGVISAESANHNVAEILSSINNVDINEVKGTAHHYAINYLQKRGGIDE